MGLADVGHRLNEIFSINPFPTAVNSLSTFLIAFGIALHPTSRSTATGESEHVRVDLFEDSALIYLSITPKLRFDNGSQDPLSKARALSQASLSLSEILYAVDPDIGFVKRRPGSFKEVRAEIERQLGLLVHYCRPMLEGDFSAWPDLEGCIRPVFGPVGDETLQDWALRAKHMLLDAVENRRYALANDLCAKMELFQVEFTREEKAACRLAAREVAKLRRQ